MRAANRRRKKWTASIAISNYLTYKPALKSIATCKRLFTWCMTPTNLALPGFISCLMAAASSLAAGKNTSCKRATSSCSPLAASTPSTPAKAKARCAKTGKTACYNFVTIATAQHCKCSAAFTKCATAPPAPCSPSCRNRCLCRLAISRNSPRFAPSSITKH